MKIVTATYEQISEWHSIFLDTCKDYKQAMQVIIGLGGDRLVAIQDGGGFFAQQDEEIVGVISYSPTGEHGCPNIIGMWVKNDDIDIAVELAKSAIDALQGSELIVVEVYYQIENDAFQESRIGTKRYNRLDLRRTPWISRQEEKQ